MDYDNVGKAENIMADTEYTLISAGRPVMLHSCVVSNNSSETVTVDLYITGYKNPSARMMKTKLTLPPASDINHFPVVNVGGYSIPKDSLFGFKSSHADVSVYCTMEKVT